MRLRAERWRKGNCTQGGGIDVLSYEASMCYDQESHAGSERAKPRRDWSGGSGCEGIRERVLFIGTGRSRERAVALQAVVLLV
jgi:hypothetical protein